MTRGPVDAAYVDPRRIVARKAAASLGVELGDFLSRRPLSSVWQAGDKLVLVVLDERAGGAERERFLSSARRMGEMYASVPGVLHVHATSRDPAAFTADLCATGAMEDLPALRWSLRQKAGFLRQVTKTVRALHELGVVHGCLCPANIQLDDELHAVLAEVGMVSLHESFAGDPDNVFGYGAYAAPEVSTKRPLDARSDVFSIGRLLEFLILEGTPSDDKADALTAATKASPILLDIGRRCTAASADARYRNAAELLDALDPVVNALLAVEGSASAAGHGSVARSEERRQPREVDAPVGPASPVGPARSLRKPLAALGLTLFVGSTAFAYFVGPHVVSPGALTAVLALGGGLATLLVPALRRWPASRILLALGCGVLLLVVEPHPLQIAYRRGAERRMRGDDASRRNAVLELVKTGRDLRGAQLAGLNLAEIDLVAADLRGADLRGADLSRAKLWGAMLGGAVLDGAHLSGTDLSESSVEEAMGFRSTECDGGTKLPRDWRCVDGHPGKSQ